MPACRHQQQILGAVHHLDAHHGPGLFRDHVVADTQAAAVRDAVLLHGGALAEAPLRDGQDRLVRVGTGGAHHIVAVPQADAPDAHGDPGPWRRTSVSSKQTACPSWVAMSIRSWPRVSSYGDELIALIQRQGADAVVPQVLQGAEPPDASRCRSA